MGFVFAFIGIIALIVLFPYIRCFFKRLKCARKIKKLCRQKGYRISKTHKLWFLGNKYAKKCDLHVETENEVLSIKLFGMPRRLSILILKENGEFFIRSYIALISAYSSFLSPINSKPKQLPVYDFKIGYRNEWDSKTQRRILLINPISMETRRQPHHGGEIVISSGDTVNGMEIYSLPRLLEDMENAQ